jgi:hypothetical protein
MPETIIATPKQAYVIQRPHSARLMVIAGPGAGKTWTLLRRASALVESRELDAGSVLVLSFTRAVVHELRKRDRELEEPSRLRPETFDSFATRLLREYAADESWMAAGFDRRIELATELVREESADEEFAELGHIFLDEIQDLVSPRSDFVQAVLESYSGGFSAFGDPAQAIYDHERGRLEAGFMDALKALSGEIIELPGNHRTNGDLARATAELRDVILAEDGDDALDAARDALLDLDTFGGFDDLAGLLEGGLAGGAILCRDNATALDLARRLRDAGIEHRVRQGTSDRPIAGWVGALIGDHNLVTEDTVAERHALLSGVNFPGLPTRSEAWRLLSRLDPGSRGGGVRTSEAASRIGVGRVPWELLEEQDHGLVISSIHRAKGLEFDDCFVVNWQVHSEQDESLEARVLYVALTRAREDCYSVNRPTRREWYRNAKAGNRFIKSGPEAWHTFGIEIRGEDMLDFEPAGHFGFEGDSKEIQGFFIEEVRPGDNVMLSYLDDLDLGRGLRPVYCVEHEKVGPIGITGAPLGDALGMRLRGRRPQRITGTWIHGLETVKGSPDAGAAAGLGNSGLWLRPRLVGLGDFEWEAEND